MKATGEVMAIAPTFEQAIMKAVRGAEISHDTLNDKEFAELSNARFMTDSAFAMTEESSAYMRLSREALQ